MATRAFRILGISGEVCTLELGAEQTVGHLKAAVEGAAGIPAHEQRLLDGTAELRSGSAGLDTVAPGEATCELTLVRRDPEQAEWLQRVEADFAGNALQRAPEHIREDREVILAAMRRRPVSFRFAAPSLQADRDFMLKVVRENENALQYAPRHLLADREVMLEACAHHGRAIQFASRELRSDHEVALTAARADSQAVKYLPHELWSNRDFIHALVQIDGQALKIASADLHKDREVCLAAARSDGSALEHASPDLLADRDFVVAAAKVSKLALKYASKQLQGDIEVVRAVVQVDGSALRFAPLQVRADRDVVLEAVRTDAEAVAFAARELWTADFFLAAVERNQSCLRYCPPQLGGHRRWVLAAARHAEEALKFAADELREDVDFVLQVLECGFEAAVQYASPSLLRHPDFLLAASRKSDSALRYASEELRGDPALVRSLVNRHGCSLQYAAPELRADSTVALTAVIADPAAAEFVAPELWSDAGFVASVRAESKVSVEDFLSKAPKSGPDGAAAAPRSGEAEAKPQSRGDAETTTTASSGSEASQLNAPEPDAKAMGALPRRPRTLVPTKAADHPAEDSGQEPLDFPCAPPAPDCGDPAKPTGAGTGTQQAPADQPRGTDRQLRMLPWCLPMPSERYKVPPLVQSGLQSAALRMKIQAAQSKPEDEEAEEQDWEQQEQEDDDGAESAEPPSSPLESVDEVKLGDHLRVLGDPEAIVRACREAGMDFANSQHDWPASADKYVKVLAVDPMDGSLECRVPGVGDVWLAHAVLLPVVAEAPLRSMMDAQVGSSLRVLRDTTAVLEACLTADLGSIEDESSWEAAAGKVVEVIGRDPKDRTVECHVPGVGEVWFALSALRRA